MNAIAKVPIPLAHKAIDWKAIKTLYHHPELRSTRGCSSEGVSQLRGIAVYKLGTASSEVRVKLYLSDTSLASDEAEFLAVAVCDDDGAYDIICVSRGRGRIGNYYQIFTVSGDSVVTIPVSSASNGSWRTADVDMTIRIGLGFRHASVSSNGVHLAQWRMVTSNPFRKIFVIKGHLPPTRDEASLGLVTLRRPHLARVVETSLDHSVRELAAAAFEWDCFTVYLSEDFLAEVDTEAFQRAKEAEADMPQSTDQSGTDGNDTSQLGQQQPKRQRSSKDARVKLEEIDHSHSTAIESPQLDSQTPFESVEEKAALVDDLNTFIEKGDLNTVLNLVQIPEFRVLETNAPQFMMRSDAVVVGKRICRASETIMGDRSRGNASIFIIAMLQAFLTFSTSWPLLDDVKYALTIESCGRRHNIDFYHLFQQWFSPFPPYVYRNPLRQYARYWSATTVLLIKKGLLHPNYNVLARHGVTKTNIPYCFDYVVMDARFNSRAEKLGSVLAKEIGLRNRKRFERVNLIHDLYCKGL